MADHIGAATLHHVDVLVTSQVAFPSDTTNPAMQQLKADMKKYQAGEPVKELTICGWSAVHLFAKVMAGSASFAGSDVMSPFKSIKTLVETGTSGPFSDPKGTPLVAESPICSTRRFRTGRSSQARSSRTARAS